MKLECSSCNMRYTIDDTIIPPLGAKVRCRKCGNTIVVPASSVADRVVLAPTETPVVPPPAPATPPTPAVSFTDAPALPPVTYTAPASTPVPPPVPAPPPSPSNGDAGSFSFFPSEGGSSAQAAPVRTPAPAASPSQSPSPSPAGTSEMLSAEEKKQHEKARRLARVLASDIAIYNREKKDRGLAEGNLVAVLGYEIKKSWEIYKERVGADFANATPYFRDALNDLLAEGKKIF